jgi:acetyl esterase
MATTTYSPVIDPATKAWVDRLEAESADSPPLYELSPKDAREVLRSVQASVSVELAPAGIEDRTIAGGPTGEINIRIIRPANAIGALPMILHTHGGGWVLGGKDTHERLYRELANATQATVVFVDYTPAPDAQYPVQIEQAYAALEWALEHAGEIGVIPARAAFFGDSVGGNMAAALTLMAKERRGPKLAAQVLFYPVTSATFATETYERYADGPWLTREAMRWFWDSYLPDEERRWEVTASPLMASLDQLRDLPPALVINGQHDVLCAEGEAYARRLMEAGVPVTQVRYGGTIHDFVLLNPITGTPAVRAAIAQAAGYLRKALAA